MRSPFKRLGNITFSNGPNNTDRSVWVGGTSLIGQLPQIDRGEEEEETVESSSSNGLIHSDSSNNHTRPLPTRPSLIKRMKSLSPRREIKTDETDNAEIFFSPDSIPPSESGAANDGKVKKRSSVSIGGESIMGDDNDIAPSINRRSNRPSHVTARRKRSISKSSARRSTSSERLGSITSFDVTSRSLTLSSLEESGESSHARIEEGVDLEAALIPREDEKDDDSSSYVGTLQIESMSSCAGSKRKQVKAQHSYSSNNRQHAVVKRQRLSRRARTRLTMREVNSNIQPGRNDSLLDESMGLLEKRKAITLPKTIDFFLQIEMKLIAVIIMISVLLTVLVLQMFPDTWQTALIESSRAVSLLGAFLSFALVFRTSQTYARWYEAR